MWAKNGAAEVEQILYYSIPGTLLISYVAASGFALGLMVPIDAAFLAAGLIASIPAGFIVYQAYTSNMLPIYSRIWRKHDNSEPLKLIASKLSTKDPVKAGDLAKRIMIVISNEKDHSGYSWKLLNLVNSRGACIFSSVLGMAIPVLWIVYKASLAYIETGVLEDAWLNWQVAPKLVVYYVVVMLLAVSFYRAIPKILRQLSSYNNILVAMNAKELESIAEALRPQA